MGSLVRLADYRARRAQPPLQRGDIVRHRRFDWAGMVRGFAPSGLVVVAVGRATHLCPAESLRRVPRLVVEDGLPCDTERQI